MHNHNYPILEYDPAREALIEPGRVLKLVDGMPQVCVMCFFQKVIGGTCEDAPVLAHMSSEIGRNPVYGLKVDGRSVAVFHPGVGAPLAAAFLDEIIAMGCAKFIACGGAGVLDSSIPVGHVIVPVSAVRDEGTSYHYLPPGREVAASPEAVAAITATLEAHGIPYDTGKTWTTDAIYRETPQRIARRRDEGCISVEMEAAAFFAVAQFRGVTLGQILYGGDDVGGQTWDSRRWIHSQASTREKLFWLAVEAALRLDT